MYGLAPIHIYIKSSVTLGSVGSLESIYFHVRKCTSRLQRMKRNIKEWEKKNRSLGVYKHITCYILVGPLSLLMSCMSLGIRVTRLACSEHM